MCFAENLVTPLDCYVLKLGIIENIEQIDINYQYRK